MRPAVGVVGGCILTEIALISPLFTQIVSFHISVYASHNSEQDASSCFSHTL